MSARREHLARKAFEPGRKSWMTRLNPVGAISAAVKTQSCTSTIRLNGMSDWPYSTEQWQRLRRNGPMSDPSYLVQTVIDLGRNGMTMDVKETLDFQNAIKPWISKGGRAHQDGPEPRSLGEEVPQRNRRCADSALRPWRMHHRRGMRLPERGNQRDIPAIPCAIHAVRCRRLHGARRCKGAMIGKVALQHTGMDTLTQSEAGTTAALRSVYEARSTNTR